MYSNIHPPRSIERNPSNAFVLIEVIPQSLAHRVLSQWADELMEMDEKGLVTLVEITANSQSAALISFCQMLGCENTLFMRLQILQALTGGGPRD